MGQGRELIKLMRLEADWKILLEVPNEAKIEQSTNPPKKNCSGQEKRSCAKQEPGYKQGRQKRNGRDL